MAVVISVMTRQRRSRCSIPSSVGSVFCSRWYRPNIIPVAPEYADENNLYQLDRL
jgi:hypothetical protein